MSTPLPTLTPLPTPTAMPADTPATSNYPSVYNSVVGVTTSVNDTTAGSIDFVLSELNQEVTMTEYAKLETEQEVLQANAIATYEVKIDDMKAVFQFATDDFFTAKVNASSGVSRVPIFNNAKFFIDSSVANIQTYQPASASVYPADGGSGAIVGNNVNGAQYSSSNMKVENDFIRYLALGLFGTPYGEELFANTPELLTNLEYICGPSGAWGQILALLQAVDLNTGSDAGLVTDSLSGKKCIVTSNTDALYNKSYTRILLDQLDAVNPQRLYDSAHGIQDTTGIQPFPFVVGDTINWKLTIHPHASQYMTTRLGLSHNPDTLSGRSYIIKFKVVA